MTTGSLGAKTEEALRAIQKLGYTVAPKAVLVNGERRFFVNGQAKTLDDIYRLVGSPPRHNARTGQ